MIKTQILVDEGQGQKSALAAVNSNYSVMEISAWAQEHFQSLSVNPVHCAMHKCRLKLYHTVKKPCVNMMHK